MDRPIPSLKAPDLTQPESVLRYLLATELERLEVARRIEQERNIVFPETSVIVHDIERLMTELKQYEYNRGE